MTGTAKQPSSSPATYKNSNKREQQLKIQGKGGRQEPRSDPTGTKFHPGELDSLSEEQLRKLTKANTKKNHGSRSSRLRSQVERVFRRLDNLAADVKLQPRYSIDALPVVSPCNPSAEPKKECNTESDEHGTTTHSGRLQQRIDHQTPRSPETKVSYGLEQKPDPISLENEEFEIEPATNNSSFIDSPNAVGVQSAPARSVRISTSVTVLDYIPAQPVSVATLQRFEHPTRTGKYLQTRKFPVEEFNFPHVMQRLEQMSEGEHQTSEQRDEKRDSMKENTSQRMRARSPPPPQRTRSTGSAPIAFIVPTPTGPYGSRTNLE